MKKQKLMIVFWNLDIGGIQTIIRDVVLYLDATHPEVGITILIRDKTDSQIIRDIQRKTRATLYSVTNKSKRNLLNRIYFFLRLIYIYLKLKPDICLTFLDTLSIAIVTLRNLVFWRNVRIVLNENLVTSKNNRINRTPIWFWNWSVSFYYQRADAIIVPSEACKTDLISNFAVPESKIVIGRNWTLLSKKPLHKPLYNLVYVGRFDKEKNTFAFIDLIKHLRKQFPKITLCLVGKGKEEGKLQKLVIEHGLQRHIIFAGYQSDVVHYLNRSKIFIMTTRNEGTPVALLEANSQSLPSVVTRFLGSEEVVYHGKTGFIADSVSDMCRYIGLLLRNSRRRRLMGKQAEKFVKLRYGKENMKQFVHYILNI